MGKSVHTVWVLSVASAVLSGCFLWTTRGEGEEFQTRTKNHERRLASLEQGVSAEVNRAQAKVAELEAVLEKATQVVTRNSADIGVEVGELREQIARLEGQIAELRNQVEASDQQRQEMEQQVQRLSQKTGAEVTLQSSDIPAERSDHYGAAYRAFQAKEYGQARALFREYIRRYPRDTEADNAQYWVGKSYLVEERPATALGEFRKVIAEHASGDAVDETLLDMANAFYKLHACTNARSSLQALIRGHARSPLVAKARRKLRQIRRAPRQYCTD